MDEKKWSMQSALKDHQRFKKKLVPPLNRMSGAVLQIFWPRDLLPEFLWIDALVNQYGESGAASIFNDFLKSMDPLVPLEARVLDGTVTSFRAVPEDLRQSFIEAHRGKIEWAVERPLGDVIALYPRCPMGWLISPRDGRDTVVAIGNVRQAILRLMPGKTQHPAFCRALPMNRYFAHKKVFISNHLTELIDAIEKYPKGDRARAETWARTTHNIMMKQGLEKDPRLLDWSRHFWNHNQDLVPCAIHP
jgi:hypothetical protein